MLLNTDSISQYSLSILTIFGIGLGVLLGVAFIFLLMSKIKFIKKMSLIKKGAKKIIFNICFGLILGIIFGFISWVDYWQKVPIFTFINFSLLAVFAYRFSLWIFLGSLLPESAIITVLYAQLMPHFANNTFSITYLAYIAFAYLTFVIIGTILKIFNTKNRTLLIFITSFIGFVCLFFLIWLVMYLKGVINNFNFVGIISLDVLFSWISFLIYFMILRLIINFFNSYSDILQSGNFAEPGIPNQKYGIQQINELILKKKISFGYLITFKLLNEEEIITKYGLLAFYKIKNQWNDFLMMHFPFENILLFINKNHDYCLFVGFQDYEKNLDLDLIYKMNNGIKIENNNLNLLKNYLSKMPIEVVYNNEKIFLPFKAYISFYNVHSCKFDDLVDFNNLSYLTNKNKTQYNQIHIFNPKNSFNPYASFNDAEKLDKLINNSQFDVKFKKINLNSFNDLNVYSSEFLNLNLLLFNKKEIYDFAIQNDAYEIFIRYLAQLELKKAKQTGLFKIKNNLVVVDYSWDTINNFDFDIQTYLNKLENLKIEPKQLILNFDLNNYQNDMYNYEFISQSLNKFISNNIKVAFSNINENNIEIFKYFIPNYVIIESNVNQNDLVSNEYYNILFTFIKQKNIQIIN